MNPLVWKIPVIILAAMVGIYLLLLGLCCFLKIAVMLQIKSGRESIKNSQINYAGNFVIKFDSAFFVKEYVNRMMNKIMKDDTWCIICKSIVTQNGNIIMAAITVRFETDGSNAIYTGLASDSIKDKLNTKFNDKELQLTEYSDIFKPCVFVYDCCKGISPLDRYALFPSTDK